MPTKFGCDAGTGGQRRQRAGRGLGQVLAEAEPEAASGSRRQMPGISGVPWTQPPSRSASPISIRFWSRKYGSGSVRASAEHGADRKRRVGRREAAAGAREAADRLVRDRVHQADLGRQPRDPLDRAARPERPPLVEEQRHLAVRLRQQDQQPVDVLARVVDDRQEARRARRVGVLGVPAEVVRPLARELEAPVVDLALDRVRVRQPVVLRRGPPSAAGSRGTARSPPARAGARSARSPRR